MISLLTSSGIASSCWLISDKSSLIRFLARGIFWNSLKIILNVPLKWYRRYRVRTTDETDDGKKWSDYFSLFSLFFTIFSVKFVIFLSFSEYFLSFSELFFSIWHESPFHQPIIALESSFRWQLTVRKEFTVSEFFFPFINLRNSGKSLIDFTVFSVIFDWFFLTFSIICENDWRKINQC